MKNQNQTLNTKVLENILLFDNTETANEALLAIIRKEVGDDIKDIIPVFNSIVEHDKKYILELIHFNHPLGSSLTKTVKDYIFVASRLYRESDATIINTCNRHSIAVESEVKRYLNHIKS